MLRRELTCQELVELVTDYFDGAMSRRDRRRFERHLGACDGCTSYVRQLHAIVSVSVHLRTEELPQEVVEPLLAGFRDWHAAA